MSAMRLTSVFGTRLLLSNPRVTEHEWGEVVSGWGRVEGELHEHWIVTRLASATDVKWYPTYEEAEKEATQ